MFQEMPDIIAKQMVERFDVVFQNWLSFHVWAHIAIINAIEWVQLQGISFKMTRQKG